MILLSVIFVQSYRQGKHSIDDQIRAQMKICSFDLKCEGLQVDFVPKTEKRKVRHLYKAGDVYSFFEIPTVDDYLLKVLLPQQEYEKRVAELKNDLFKAFLLYALMIGLLSFLFSLYALSPIKRALRLNEEFVKDILHDINTPLSSMVINFKLFKKEIGENPKIERMEKSVATILSLQNNLQAFLDDSKLQKERFALEPLLQERIAYFRAIYPALTLQCEVPRYEIYTAKEPFVRIVDNLLSNACKYNTKEGRVTLQMHDYLLLIEDTGAGIENVEKVFERHYREHARGLGIGMHIVKKLCDALDIEIRIESEPGKGTIVALDLEKVIVK